MTNCLECAAVSIVEKTRQYLKSTHGMARRSVPRSMSFCQFTFLTRLPVVLVVEDAQQDKRYVSYPLHVSVLGFIRSLKWLIIEM